MRRDEIEQCAWEPRHVDRQEVACKRASTAPGSARTFRGKCLRKILAALIGAAFAASGANAQDQQYLTCSTQNGSGPNLTVHVSEVFRYDITHIDQATSAFKSYLTGRYGFQTYANCPAFPTAAEAVKHFEYVQSYALKNKARVSIERWAPSGASSADVVDASPEPSRQSTASAPTVTNAPPRKYVEVDGPNGKMRLSPEVAARNQAAAEEYRRKTEAHARDKAEHDRKMAEYQDSIARAGRTLRDHEVQLRAQQEEHQKQLREHAARVKERDSDTPCARYRRANGAGWKVNPCV